MHMSVRQSSDILDPQTFSMFPGFDPTSEENENMEEDKEPYP